MRIRQKLCDTTPQGSNHRIIIFGTGGVGKTQIAIEYIANFETQYDGIYWINASIEAELLTGFQAIADITQCVNTASLTLSEIAQAVQSWLYSTKHWLLVLDNLDDITVAGSYLPRPRIGGGHVLIISRNSNNLNIPKECFQIEVHERNEAKNLLLRRIKLSDEIGPESEVEEEAMAIVESLGCLALAIVQAAAYIREELKNDIFEFRRIFPTCRIQIHDPRSVSDSDYKTIVAAICLKSMTVIRDRNPQAVQLLQLFAFLNPDGISIQFLEAGRESVPESFHVRNEMGFNANFMKALSELERFSLISRPNSELIVIHRLIQSVIKDELMTGGFDWHRDLVCNIGLSALHTFVDDNRLECREWQEQIIPIVMEIKELRTMAAGHLLERVGQFFVKDGKVRDGQSFLYSAASTLRLKLGHKHPATLAVMTALARSRGLLHLQFNSDKNASIRTILGKGRRSRLAGSPPFRAKVISPSGNRVCLGTENEYWIWKTSLPEHNSIRMMPEPQPLDHPDFPLLCTGHFKRKSFYYYTNLRGEEDYQTHDCKTLSDFHCAALSDDFIAISAGHRVLLFEGSGRCLFYTEFRNTFVSHLRFSPDGMELLVLSNTKALIASTSKFKSNSNIKNIEGEEDCFKEIANWGTSSYRPRQLAFSSDGKRIVICTSHSSNGFCEIRILQCDNGLWKVIGQHEKYLGGPAPGPGDLTGIQLYTPFRYD